MRKCLLATLVAGRKRFWLVRAVLDETLFFVADVSVFILVVVKSFASLQLLSARGDVRFKTLGTPIATKSRIAISPHRCGLPTDY